MTTDQVNGAMPSRRSLAQGAVWSVPVLVGVAAAPAVAASVCTPVITYTADAPTSTGGYKVESNWPVPAGVTSVTFSVLGGGGGGYAANGGGAGALVKGTLAVAAGDVLTLIVGAGGAGPSDTGNVSNGGTGWGDGGTSGALMAASGHYSGCGGGGASAILKNDLPVVIAGGGGGAGRLATSPTTATQVAATGPIHGGDGDRDAGLATVVWTPASGPTRSVTVQGGLTPVDGGTAGGAGGATSAASATPAPLGSGTNIESGLWKVAGDAGNQPNEWGSDGAVGAALYWSAFGTNPAIAAGGISAGGGGGGYGGGGGGGAAVARYNDTLDGTPKDNVVGVAGGGGGGGSIALEGSNVTYALGPTRNGNPLVRSPGAIILTYCVA